MNERSRLVWRCRRGTKELDIMFENFLARGFDSLSDSERETFERLLDQQDDQLQDWFLGRSQPEDGELAQMVERIAKTPRF